MNVIFIRCKELNIIVLLKNSSFKFTKSVDFRPNSKQRKGRKREEEQGDSLTIFFQQHIIHLFCLIFSLTFGFLTFKSLANV